MAKNAYLTKIRLQNDAEKFEVWKRSKQNTMDVVTITLGQMGFSKEKMREFFDNFNAVNKEYSDEVVSDFKVDKQRDYSKAVLDRLIKQYVPDDLFVPYEERYDL